MTLRHLHLWAVSSLALTLIACAPAEPGPTAAPQTSATPAEQASGEAQADKLAKTPSAKPAAQVTNAPKSTAQRAPRAPKAKTPEVPFEGRRVALVHTANVIGELEPCG